MTQSRVVLVTGAAGFIGSHVCEALLSRGDRVVGLDNFDPFYSRGLKDANLRAIRQHPHAADRFEFIQADITNASDMRALVARVQPIALVHLAGKAGVRPSLADPAGYVNANVLGTAALLEACRAAAQGLDRMVIASSSSVYGNNKKTPFAEDDRVDEPISPYAATKKATELIAHAHWSITRTPTACLRFFTVFGPRQRPDLAIANFMQRIAAGKPITVFGDGSMRRDFTFINDIVHGVLAALDRIPQHGFRVWNLGSDRPIRLDEMVASVTKVVGRTPILDRRPPQPGDVEATWADLTRARAELDYATRTSFDQGLQAQWQWLQSQPPAIQPATTATQLIEPRPTPQLARP